MAGSPILDSGGKPMAQPSSPVMYRDGVTEAIECAAHVNRFGFGAQYGGLMHRMFAPQLAYAAYLCSGMMQKVIELPASDRVREWRDWQAEEAQIEKLEAEERRLGLRAKVKAAEILRGLGGGALILVTAGNHSKPLDPKTIREGGLIAVNVVSRAQLQLVDIDRELASPTYGQPRVFRISGSTGGQTDIHPSRVVCFKGSPLVAGYGISDEDAFWGQSMLLRVWREVEKSDHAQAWFAELVKKAKLLRIGIPNLTDFSGPDAQGRLNRRMAAIAQSESILNAVVFDAGDGKGQQSANPGETITDYQVTWAGIPAMMDAFDQRVGAVSNIPFTVLMGRSPAGMNSTGDHDRQNWHREVAAGQELELRSCLDQIDTALVPSALGSVPKDLWWQFAPLDTPTEAEEATRFKTTVEAMEKLQLMGVFAEKAFAPAARNTIVEGGWMPGIDASDAANSDLDQVEPGDDDDDPSAIQGQQREGGDPESAGRGGSGSGPARRAANDALLVQDATPRTLYVQRKLLNAAEFVAWAKGQGFESVTSPDELHVTIAYSKTPLDWMKIEGEDWNQEKDGTIEVPPGGVRIVEALGEKGAVVLLFTSSRLSWRHEQIIRAGASHDFPEYQPHVTITYAKPEGLDLAKVEPFRGKLRFGPEIFETQTDGWRPSES